MVSKYKTNRKDNMEEVIFENKNWAISRHIQRPNTIWIDSLRRVQSYGSTQSALIMKDGRVVYDFPEYLPKYIKKIVEKQSYRETE